MAKLNLKDALNTSLARTKLYIDTELAKKADSSHTHSASDITSGTLSVDRLTDSGATAGSYGQSANATPGYSGTFNVPYITVDKKGRITAASTKTITLPQNTSVWVENSLTSTSTKDALAAIQGKILKDMIDEKANNTHGPHLELGTTSSTAYRGDYGNTAYTHAISAHAPSNAQKNSDITQAEIEAKLTGYITSHTHGYAPVVHASTATSYGAASASNYGHAMASSTTPKANGTAAVGSETAKFARGDHIHPLQTTVSGNAGTATKLATARTLTVGNTGKTFDGSGNVSWSLAEIGAFPVAGGTLSGPIIGETRFVGNDLTYSDPWMNTSCALKVTGKIASTDTIKAPTFEGNASSATKLATTRAITIGNKSNNFDGSAAITYTLADIGAAPASHGTHVSYGGNGSATTVSRSDHTHSSYAHIDDGLKSWGCNIKCATWSRLFYFKSDNVTTGGSFIFNVRGTRNSVVYDATFMVNFSHSQKCKIVQLNNSDYSNVQVRGITKDGEGYIEIYDNVNGTTNTTTQNVSVSFIRLSNMSLTMYTAFTDGSTIPSGFAENAKLTTVSGSYYSGTAANANKVNNTLSIQLNGGTATAFDGSAAKSINITPASIGAAGSSHGTHLTLGTGSGNAYRGDYGNTAYNHSQAAHAPSNAQKNSDITKTEIENKLTGTIGSHMHDYITSMDTRSTNSAPNTYTTRGIFPEFKSTGTVGLPNSGKNFAGVITYQQWGDTTSWSGGKATQFATIDDGRMYFRKGEGTSWGAWNRFYTNLHKPDLEELGAAPANHNHVNSYVSKTTSTAARTASLNEPEIVNLDNNEVQAKVAEYALYRIATIKTSYKAAKDNFAISMKVIASDLCESELYIYFAPNMNDPGCENYEYTPSSYAVSCELYKKAANTWDLYVSYCNSSGGETAYIIDVKNFSNFPITYYSSSQCEWASSLSSYTKADGWPRYSW